MAFCVIAGAPLRAKEKWVRMESSGAPHTSGVDGRGVAAFEVVSDAGERAARRALDRLGLLQAALAPGGTCPLPVRVVLFANESQFAAYRDDPYVKGFYQSGPDVDTIVLFEQERTLQVLAHEFVHLVRNHQPGSALSRWLEEGLAEYYSTIEFRKGMAIMGQDIEEHSRRLQNPESSDEPAQYAKGWAAARAAILAVRGSVEVRRPVAMPEPGVARVVELGEVEAMVLRAGLLLQVGHAERAADLFEKIAAANPNSAESQLGLFQLAMFRGDRAAARKHIARAIDLGAGSDATFEYAMLQRESGAVRSAVKQWLDRTLALSPRHAEAHMIAGIQATADGDSEAALRHLRAAAAILPRQASVWHALGYAELKAGLFEGARESAARSLAAAKDEAERKMAESLALLIETPKAIRGTGAAVITPESWQPQTRGGLRAEGRLVRVECGGNGAELFVEAGSARVQLTATGETRVTRFRRDGEESSAGAEIPCPLPEPRRVRVEYVRRGGILVLTAIEFLER